MSVETKVKVVTMAHRFGAVLLTILANMSASAGGPRVRTV